MSMLVLSKAITQCDTNTCDFGCSTLLGTIGNIVSFVRLVKAASKKASASEMPYMSSTAAHQTDDLDHIRSFVSEFRSVLQESNVPSSNGFFCSVPGLCLNWLDASSQGKESMLKKNITRDGYFCNDGFALGLMFCLVVLDQVKQYER